MIFLFSSFAASLFSNAIHRNPVSPIAGPGSFRGNDNETCPLYLFKVLTPPNYYATINFLQNETTTSDVHYGVWLQEWKTTNLGKQNMLCSLDADNTQNGPKCQIFGENNLMTSSKTIQGAFNDTGSSQGWVDVNGDGHIDFCRLKHCAPILMCNVSDGAKFKDDDWSSDEVDVGVSRRSRWWVDVNGDSCTDFCRITEEGMMCNLGDKNKDHVFTKTVQFSDDDWGSKNSRTWADIEGSGKPAFCRVVDHNKIRCNVQTTTGWKAFESGVQAMGTPGFRYWVHIDGGPGASFCRLTSSTLMQCTSFNNQKFSGALAFTLPASPKGPSDITFVDLGGRGLLDICVLDEQRKLHCQLNYGNNRWSKVFTPSFKYDQGSGDFGDAGQVIFPRHGPFSAYCRKISHNQMKCMQIEVKVTTTPDDSL